jgi:hypothetical protein
VALTPARKVAAMAARSRPYNTVRPCAAPVAFVISFLLQDGLMSAPGFRDLDAMGRATRRWHDRRCNRRMECPHATAE